MAPALAPSAKSQATVLESEQRASRWFRPAAISQRPVGSNAMVVQMPPAWPSRSRAARPRRRRLRAASRGEAGRLSPAAASRSPAGENAIVRVSSVGPCKTEAGAGASARRQTRTCAVDARPRPASDSEDRRPLLPSEQRRARRARCHRRERAAAAGRWPRRRPTCRRRSRRSRTRHRRASASPAAFPKTRPRRRRRR